MKQFYKIFVAAIIFISTQEEMLAQSNYTRTYVARQAAQTSLKNKPVSQVNVSTVYADGLSRPVQSVVKQGSNNQKDVILHYEYDQFGRRTKNYLPFAHSSATSGNYISGALSLQQNEYGSYGFSESVLENSPIGRVLRQGAPGQPWQVSGTHVMEFRYEVHDPVSETVYKWFVSEAGVLYVLGEYETGDLTVQTMIDEEGRKVKHFSDQLGRQILKKVEGPGAQWLETYHVYDDFSNLRFVLPPSLVKQVSDNYGGSTGSPVNQDINLNQAVTQSETYVVTPGYAITLQPGFSFVAGTNKTFIAKVLGEEVSGDLLSELAYQYKYDERQRLIEKKLPGAAPNYYVYDKWNRLVLTQNGEQRAANQWVYMKYDDLNRPIITGTFTDSRSLSAIKSDLTTFGRYENRTSSGHGYTLNLTFPANPPDAEILSVSYFDNYDFVGASYFASGSAFDFVSNDISSQTLKKFEGVNGLPTGGKIRIIGQSGWLRAVSYYDDYVRPIQTIGENHLGGMDRMSISYTFSGEIAESKHTHYIDDSGQPGTSIYTFKEFEYDHVGRLKKVYQQLQEGGNTPGPKILLSSFNYDERGQLVEQNLHAKDQMETDFIQSRDFQYNIRGWLTKINNGGLDQNETGADADLFGLELFYNNTLSGVATTQKYNGNISAQRWTVAHQPDDEKEKLYVYSYDALDRLTGANYKVKNQGTWSTGAGAFDVANIGYDLNGNITGMDRWEKGTDGTRTQIDDLSYTYSGNQLAAVNDAVTANNNGFTDLAETTTEYGYDLNGRLIRDDNKAITSIRYNVLDQPDEVLFSDGRKVTYTYNAVGVKITERLYENDVLQRTTDYLGGMIYTDGKLQLMRHDAGRVVVNRDGSGNIADYEYQYFLNDHQGNVRATMTSKTSQTVYLATMETENAAQEDQHFGNIDRVVSVAANHTPAPGNEAVRLNNTGSAGPSFALQVNPGDKIDTEVWAYYEGGNGYNNQLSAAVMIAAIAEAFGGINGGMEMQQSIFDAVNSGIGALGLAGSNGSTVPAAYLNYLFFNKDMVFQKGGFASVSSAANGNNEKLSLGTITVDEPGYLYVYVSNESNSSDWVYFDDLKVTVTESPLVQVADYYPYGMSMSSSWHKASTADNRYLFNGGAEKEDNTGLYYTAFRRYDPSLGRFHTIDPLAESMASLNPYHYANNNPVFFNDPDGLRPVPPNISEEEFEEYVSWAERWNAHYHYQDYFLRSTRSSNTGPFRSRLIGPGSGNHWSDKFSSPVRDYFLMSATGFEEKHGISASEFSSLLKSRGTPTQNQHGQWGYETMVFDGNHLAGFMPGTSNAIVVDTYRPEFVALGNDQANEGEGSNSNSQLGLIDHSDPIGLASTVWGGSISAGASEAARSGKYLTNAVKYAKVGGNVLGGVGFAVTTYNVGAKIYYGTDNTSDYVDFAASGALLGAGFLVSNPIGWGILIGAGVTYGVYRIAAGDEADAWINENFGFR